MVAVRLRVSGGTLLLVLCTRRLAEVEAAGLAPDLVTFNTLLKACMRGRDLPRAQQVLARIQAAGLQVELLNVCTNPQNLNPTTV